MKYLSALLTALALILALAACGGAPESQAPDIQTGPPPAEDTATEDTASEPASEPVPEEVPVYDVVEEKRFSSTYTYSDFVLDELGRVVEKKVSGSEKGTYTYEYDEEGRITAENYTSRSGSYDNYTRTYNDHGLLDTETESSDGFRDGNTYVYTYEYDEQDRPVKMTSVNTATEEGYATVYTYEYGEDGTVAVETQTTYSDGLDGPAGNSYEIRHTYDEEGRLIKSVSQKAGESSTNTSTYTYDIVGFYTPQA